MCALHPSSTGVQYLRFGSLRMDVGKWRSNVSTDADGRARISDCGVSFAVNSLALLFLLGGVVPVGKDDPSHPSLFGATCIDKFSC